MQLRDYLVSNGSGVVSNSFSTLGPTWVGWGGNWRVTSTATLNYVVPWLFVTEASPPTPSTAAYFGPVTYTEGTTPNLDNATLVGLSGQSYYHVATGSVLNLQGISGEVGVTTDGGHCNLGTTILANPPLASATRTFSAAVGVYINPHTVPGVAAGFGVYQVGPSDGNIFEGSVTVPYIVLKKLASPPTPPPAGSVYLYVGTDGVPKMMGPDSVPRVIVTNPPFPSDGQA